LKNNIFSRAPVRICDIGGWTDTWFYPEGAVFSICIDLFSHVKIVPNNTSKIKIISENLNIQTEIQDIRKIEYNGNLDLLKAAVKRMCIEKGINIYIKTDVPPGCGTGTSASVSVALIAALACFSCKKLKPNEIAKLAHQLEIDELKLESGVQDQYAATYGGINFMEIDYPSVKIVPISLNDDQRTNLEKELLLIYLGSRSSNEMHKVVIRNYQNKDDLTIKSLEIIKNCAYEMIKAIKTEDLNLMGNIMNKNWEAQKNLHPSMVNPLIKKAEYIAKKNGAIGFKLNGAGGGGSATILADIGRIYQLKRKFIMEGFQILTFNLEFKGVQTWTDGNNKKIVNTN